MKRMAIILILSLFGCASEGHKQANATQGNATCPQSAENFSDWINRFKSYARMQGHPNSVIQAAFQDLKENPAIRKSASQQPEFVTPVWTYLDRVINKERVEQGRQLLLQHRATLMQIQKVYGVPPEIILAIWGIESDFGRFKGDINVFEALSNVGYGTGRSDFACRELLAALSMADRGIIKPKQMLGSWAGAMGHTQFLPSKFLTTAIDQDRSGSPDIWNSLPDVFASTANHLKEDKWLPGTIWGMEVTLPKGFRYEEAELDRAFPITHWQKMGVKNMAGKALPPIKGDTSILLLAGEEGTAFLITQNFKALLGYNYSTSYALAVAYLGEAIAGRSGIKGMWPRQKPLLSYNERIEVQTLLKKQGLFNGKEDGVIGLGTRKAIRAFQQKYRLIADGYADKDLLATLRRIP